MVEFVNILREYYRTLFERITGRTYQGVYIFSLLQETLLCILYYNFVHFLFQLLSSTSCWIEGCYVSIESLVYPLYRSVATIL